MPTSRDGVRATPRIARAINDRLALDHLQRRGPLTAAELRRLTGLSRPTITDLLKRLEVGGLVEVIGASEAVQRGPNARLYGLRADRAHVVGLDARTDVVHVALADLAGRRRPKIRVPVGAGEAPGQIIDRVVTAIRRASLKEFDELAHTLAVGAPGVVEPDTHAIRSTGWPPRWHADLIAECRASLGMPVLAENEVNLAAIAELRHGSAQDRDTFALLWIGHGVGAGIISNGRLYRGESGGAGEVGFLAVPAPAALSKSGRTVTFHEAIGARPVCQLARRHGIAVEHGDGVSQAVAAVRNAVKTGERGDRFLAELADTIAYGVLALCVALDPGSVILGGEVGCAGGEELADRVMTAVRHRSPVRVEVRVSEMSDDAVLAGAVSTALDNAHDDLFGPPALGNDPDFH